MSFKFPVLVFGLLLLSGCVPDRVILKDISNSNIRDELRTKLDCPKIIASFEDSRSIQNIGSLGSIEVESNDFMGQLQSEFSNAGFIFDNIEGNLNRSHILNLKLKHAYVRRSYSSITSNIVVGVSTGLDSHFKYYRGNHNRLYWSDADKEINQSFSYAIMNLINDLAEDLNKQCL